MDSPSHAGFILSAYGVTAAVIGILILRAIVTHRLQQRALAVIEARATADRPAASSR